MQIVTTILAFALLMIAFSTVVSGITELILRALSLRSENLRSATKIFVRDEVWPKVRDNITKKLEASVSSRASGVQVKADETEEIERILDHLTKNMVAQPLKLFVPFTSLAMTIPLIPGKWVEKLSTEAMIERLSKSTVAEALIEEPRETWTRQVQDLSLTFDRYMAAAKEGYRKRATLFALIISIIFALGANIHAGRLVAHLRDNPDVIAGIVERQNEIVEDVVAAGEMSSSAADSANGDEPEAPGEVSVEQFENQAVALRGAVRDLQSELRLPIGWAYFPYAEEEGWMWDFPTIIGWIVNTSLAGILIGLGAPFWYRMVQILGNIRGLGLETHSKETVGSTTPTHDSDSLKRAEDHVKLFEKTVTKAHHA